MRKNDKQEILTGIVKYILGKELVHYSDIEKFTHKSRKTVSKYLDEIEDNLRKQNLEVKLVRKRNVGIYFEGDVKELIAYYNIDCSDKTIKMRLVSLLEILLNGDTPQKMDDIADELYISKSTLEKDIERLKEYGVRISSDVRGIEIDLDEDEIRAVLSKITRENLDQQVFHDENTNNYILSYQIPSELSKYIKTDTLQRIQKILKQFIVTGKVFINEYEYEAILIHIAIAIQRIINGEFIEKTLQSECKYHSKTGLLVKLLESEFNIEIPQSEKEYLNLHVLAIEGGEIDLDSPVFDNGLVKSLKRELVDYDDILLKNLAIHLRAVIKRKNLNITIVNPYKAEIFSEYPQAVDTATNLLINLSKNYAVGLNEDEVAYVAMHFQAYMERKKESLKKQLSVAIVCSTGYGTAAFLSQRLKRLFGSQINIKRTMSLEELIYEKVNVDLIISTIPIKTNQGNVIYVSPFLKDEDISLLKKYVSMVESERTFRIGRAAFLKLIDEECILVTKKECSKNEAIKLLVTRLQEKGYVTDDMYQAALQREKLASTRIDKVAIPHGNIEHTKKSIIGILVNPKGITWDKHSINIVFFIALNRDVVEEIDDIYSYFYDLISNDKHLAKMSKLDTSREIYSFLKGVD